MACLFIMAVICVIRMNRIGDNTYDIASAEYVAQYNFDVPERMELMVHVRRRGPYGSDIRENEETGLTHVCQTSLGCTRDDLDTVDVDSLAEVFAEELPVTDGFYQGTVSSDEVDFSDPDDGSIVDNERNTGLTHVCQTSLGCTRDELDTVDVDSLTEVFAEKLPVADGFYQGTVSSDERDFSDPDDGFIEDNERNTWADWFGCAF